MEYCLILIGTGKWSYFYEQYSSSYKNPPSMDCFYGSYV